MTAAALASMLLALAAAAEEAAPPQRAHSAAEARRLAEERKKKEAQEAPQIPPTQAKDMMSYCNPSFISDYNYNLIFGRIKTVNGAFIQTSFTF